MTAFQGLYKEAGGKTIQLFRAENAAAPLVLLNSYQSNNGEIYQKCRELGCTDFTLAEITGLNWHDEMTPWKATEGEMSCGGKADKYLALLLNEILPVIKEVLSEEPRTVLLAGYSLAGLFALYAATKCTTFTAVASCSGSLWFPGFKEYLFSCDTTKLPQAVYFSLGDREAHTKNEMLSTVEDKTREIAQRLSARGINTVFELNKGNHFRQASLRSAKGIKWILENLQ